MRKRSAQRMLAAAASGGTGGDPSTGSRYATAARLATLHLPMSTIGLRHTAAWPARPGDMVLHSLVRTDRDTLLVGAAVVRARGAPTGGINHRPGRCRACLVQGADPTEAEGQNAREDAVLDASVGQHLWSHFRVLRPPPLRRRAARPSRPEQGLTTPSSLGQADTDHQAR
jgi:hypothetical protein